jgi:peptidoglycan/xylan/chitin deacetylase (PgdA/CDA1 family)
MEVLRRDFQPVALSELARESPRLRRSTRMPIAVTFDDGYVDVLDEALPTLEQLEIPATVFVVSQGLGGWFWWDRLRTLLESARSLPPSLELPVGGDRPPISWRAEEGVDQLRSRISRTLRDVPEPGRAEALERLAAWLEEERHPFSSPRRLSKAELVRLAHASAIEIGSHGKSHRPLVGLSDEALHEEVEGSRRDLEQILEQRVSSFSYPHGVLDSRVAEAVRSAGYDRSCASLDSLVTPRTDVYQMPRHWSGSISGDAFRSWLNSWTGR